MLNFDEIWRAKLAKCTLLIATLVPWDLFRYFNACSDAKERGRDREWGVESNGMLPQLFFPSKTATLVPEFALEDLPLGRTAALVPEFAVKDLPLGSTL